MRHNDPEYVFTKQQTLKTHEAKTESAKRRHGQMHTIVGDFNTPYSAMDTTTSQNQQR